MALSCRAVSATPTRLSDASQAGLHTCRSGACFTAAPLESALSDQTNQTTRSRARKYSHAGSLQGPRLAGDGAHPPLTLTATTAQYTGTKSIHACLPKNPPPHPLFGPKSSSFHAAQPSPLPFPQPSPLPFPSRRAVRPATHACAIRRSKCGRGRDLARAGDPACAGVREFEYITLTVAGSGAGRGSCLCWRTRV